MKKISKRDSERIRDYILKARKIVDSWEESNDAQDELEMHDSEIAYDCIDSISGIMIALNNTIM